MKKLVIYNNKLYEHNAYPDSGIDNLASPYPWIPRKIIYAKDIPKKEIIEMENYWDVIVWLVGKYRMFFISPMIFLPFFRSLGKIIIQLMEHIIKS